MVGTNPATGEVTLNHEAIPGFMEAMTMPYKLKDANILSELHPGDVITADVLVSQGSDANVFLDHIVVVAQGKAGLQANNDLPCSGTRGCRTGFQAAQSGRAEDSSQSVSWERAVDHVHLHALPAAEFLPAGDAQLCNRLRSSFRPIRRLKGKTHLLCVSFDPEHDTPERLKAYGQEYIGSDAKTAFANWDFAVPDKPVLKEMAKFFDVGITNEPDQTITHTLSTTLVGRDGKVIKFYPGNEWTPEQVVGDVKQSLGA